MNIEEINDKIKSKGLKKNWIAEQIGVSNTRLSFYLTETRPIPAEVKRDLEQILS